MANKDTCDAVVAIMQPLLPKMARDDIVIEVYHKILPMLNAEYERGLSDGNRAEQNTKLAQTPNGGTHLHRIIRAGNALIDTAERLRDGYIYETAHRTDAGATAHSVLHLAVEFSNVIRQGRGYYHD